jgi:hypothetical protein
MHDAGGSSNQGYGSRENKMQRRIDPAATAPTDPLGRKQRMNSG